MSAAGPVKFRDEANPDPEVQQQHQALDAVYERYVPAAPPRKSKWLNLLLCGSDLLVALLLVPVIVVLARVSDNNWVIFTVILLLVNLLSLLLRWQRSR